MPTESDFWADLRKDLPREAHTSRVENPTDPGTPDVSFCLSGIEGWMELKARTHIPSTGRVLTDDHGIRPAQRIWIRDRVSAGGLVLIVVKAGEYCYFVHGSDVVTVNTWLLSDFSDNCLSSSTDRAGISGAFRKALLRYRKLRPA